MVVTRGTATELSRRSFVVYATSIGSTLAVGCRLLNRSHVRSADGVQTAVLDTFVKIGTDSSVTVVLDKLEMGQGIASGYAGIIAEELQQSLETIKIEFAPADRIFINHYVQIIVEGLTVPIPVQATSLSTSTQDAWSKLRTVGATARAMLCSAAAASWGINADQCSIADGIITASVQGRTKTAKLGEFALAAAAEKVGEVKPRDPSSYTFLGRDAAQKGLGPGADRPFLRVDGPGKVDGSLIYGIDLTAKLLAVDKLLCASIVRAPEIGASVALTNYDAIKALPGVIEVVTILNGRGIAVVAATYWQAKSAARAVQFTVKSGPNQNVSSEDLANRYRSDFADDGQNYRGFGNQLGFNLIYAAAHSQIDVQYSAPYGSHSTMEPMNAVAIVAANSCRVWAATQFQSAAQVAAAKVANLRPEQVEINTTYGGGGFGRRLMSDFISEVVAIAAQLPGTAVKLIWSREEDMHYDYFRPLSCHRMKAGINRNIIAGWQHHVGVESLTAYSAADYVGALLPPNINPNSLVEGALSRIGQAVLQDFEVDSYSTEGAVEIPYKVGTKVLRVTQLKDPNKPQIPLGFWRSVGHFSNIFAVESFFDEIAFAAQIDPAQFRLQLSEDPRQVQVLNRVMQNSGYQAGGPFGLAQVAGWGSYLALVIKVSINAGFQIHLDQVTAVVDCGFALQPDMVRSQIEGGIIFALSAATKQNISIVNGVVQQSNFHENDVIRMYEAPPVQIEIIAHDAQMSPGGVGELVVPTVAPALANAVFAATRRRMRDLPLTAARLAATNPS